MKGIIKASGLIIVFFFSMFIRDTSLAASVSLNTNELTLYVGDTYVLEGKLEAGMEKGDMEYYLYDEAKKKRVKSSKYLNLDSINGKVAAMKPGSVSVCVSYKVWNSQTSLWEKYEDKCHVTVLLEDSDKGLNYTYLNRALGSKKVHLKIKNAKEGDIITFESSNKKVAKVTKKGFVKVGQTGSAVITATLLRKGEVHTYTCEVNVSNPLLDNNAIVVEKGETSKVNIKGVINPDMVQWVLSDKNVAIMSIDGTIYGKEEGFCTVKVKAEGITLSLVIYVENNKEALNMVRLVKGEKTTLVPEGVKSGEKVTWKSSKPKKVSVDASGVINALKVGNATVSAKFGNSEVTYYVSVGNNRKAIEAVEMGESLLGCAYSTSRRMEEGYYDCSSYVYRVFAPFGYTFGCKEVTMSAPTAASLAQWCEENKCVISYEPVYDLDLLLPGDLIFYSYGGGNGRFMNIDHVAIYDGHGTIIHASDETTGVKRGNYWIDNYIVMVARPAS